MKKAVALLKKFFVWMFVKIEPDDAANGSWIELIAMLALGFTMSGMFGCCLLELFKETGNTLPPLIFSGLLFIAGVFLILGSLSEMSKKFINRYFPKLAV